MTATRLALALALAAPFLASAQGAPRRTRVAVMEIRALATDAAKADLLSEVALTEAASITGFDVIGKSDIASMLGFERQKQVAGCADDSSCLAEIGGALGVDYILVGSLGKMGTLYRLDLKVVDIKKSRVVGRFGTSVEGSEEKLIVAIQKIVHDLLGPIAPRAAPPPPQVATPAPGLAAKPPVPSPTAALTPSPATSAADRDASPRRMTTGVWAAGGVGLLLVAGGAVAGLQAQSAYDAQKKATTMQAYTDNKDRAKRMALVADGLYAGGAIGLGVATWLYFSNKPAPAVSFEVVPTPGGAVAAISGGF